ncbi:MAG: hypothetical protein DMG38_22745 [Acidobacteria bacterium]|nr:MAG: hypothetical protein DMG38_22745 [Acidobacteriota bacterium]
MGKLGRWPVAVPLASNVVAGTTGTTAGATNCSGIRHKSHLLSALENFRSLGIDFISFSEQLDTSTPTGKWSSPSWVEWRARG